MELTPPEQMLMNELLKLGISYDNIMDNGDIVEEPPSPALAVLQSPTDSNVTIDEDYLYALQLQEHFMKEKDLESADFEYAQRLAKELTESDEEEEVNTNNAPLQMPLIVPPVTTTTITPVKQPKQPKPKQPKTTPVLVPVLAPTTPNRTLQLQSKQPKPAAKTKSNHHMFVVADTNCFIKGSATMTKLLNKPGVTLVIPDVVFRELDGLKNSKDNKVGNNARMWIRSLLAQMQQFAATKTYGKLILQEVFG